MNYLLQNSAEHTVRLNVCFSVPLSLHRSVVSLFDPDDLRSHRPLSPRCSEFETSLLPVSEPRGDEDFQRTYSLLYCSITTSQYHDVQQLMDQQDHEPDPLHIKEELWTCQEGEQLHGLEETDIKFPFTPVPVKSEEDEAKPQFSQLHQRQTEQMEPEGDGVDCGGPGPHMNSDPQPETGDSETDDSDDWKETRKAQSGLNSLNNNEEAGSDETRIPPKKLCSCSECGKGFPPRGHMKVHMLIHTSRKHFDCSVCGRRFTQKANLIRHMPRHTGEKPYSCSICKKSFRYAGDVGRHMRVHTAATHSPTNNQDPGRHLKCDSGEETRRNVNFEKCYTDQKLCICSECGKRFSSKTNLNVHMRVHTGEKPFGCSVCGRRFNQKANLIRHMPRHTGEKPYSCFICKNRFRYAGDVGRHMKIHSRENLSTSRVSDTEPRENPSTSRVSNTERRGNPSTSFGNNTEPSNTPSDGHEGLISRLNPEAGKTGDYSGTVISNEMRNSETEPFICSECGKVFTRKYSLKSHMRIHSGEKPYSCSICQNLFRYAGEVGRHMKLHHGENSSTSHVSDTEPRENPSTSHVGNTCNRDATEMVMKDQKTV